MLKIDNSLLQELGLGTLPDPEKNSLLKHIYETLEMRVGIRLADQMSNQQLDEFEQYFEAKDDAGAFKWLETNFPNYKEIVQEEFDKLKAEVGQSAPQILAASQAAAQMPQGQEGVAPAAPQPAQEMPQPAPYDQPGVSPQAAPAPAQPYAAPQPSQPAPQPYQSAPAQPQPPYQPSFPQQPTPDNTPPVAPSQPQPPFPPQQPPAGPQPQ
jgi:hypothetical protein